MSSRSLRDKRLAAVPDAQLAAAPTLAPMLPPMVVQFATNADLATRLGLTLTSAEQARADRLLQIVSGQIQAEARQAIKFVSNDVLTRPGTTDDTIRLPERPVVSVASVTLDGTPLNAGGDYVLVGDVLVRPSASGTFGQERVLIDDGWGDPTRTIVVTYTHGFAVIPDALVALCCEPVVRVWVNPGNVLSESMGPESTVYAPRSGLNATLVGLMLTPDEKDFLHDYLRRRAGSVPLR